MKFAVVITAILLILYGMLSPLIVVQPWDFKLFVHDFSKDGTLEWFLRDLNYNLFLIAVCYFWFKSATGFIRFVAFVVLCDWCYELFDLVVYNNEYDLKGLLIQNSVLILSIIYYKFYLDHAGTKTHNRPT